MNLLARSRHVASRLLFALPNAGIVAGRFELGTVIHKMVDTVDGDRHSATAEIIPKLSAETYLPEQVAGPSCGCTRGRRILAKVEDFQRTALLVANIRNTYGFNACQAVRSGRRWYPWGPGRFGGRSHPKHSVRRVQNIQISDHPGSP